jgi:hypothetical protein
MKKIINPGIINIGSEKGANLYCAIELSHDGRLSISGVEGPLPSGNARGSCGQIIMHEWDFKSYSKGWSPSLVRKFRAVWDEYHLNDMKAGSPAQEAFLKANPVTYTYPESHYEKACEALAAAGLNPDPNYLHEGKPYKYGSAWLRAEVPNEVISFLAGLPNSENQPAWV